MGRHYLCEDRADYAAFYGVIKNGGQDLDSGIKMTTIAVCGVKKEYPRETTYRELAREYQPEYLHDIVLVNVNGKLQELHKKLKPDSEVTFVTTTDSAGSSSYRRSVTQLMLKAVYDVTEKEELEKVSVLFSLSKGYYCKVAGKVKVDEAFLARVKARMDEMVRMDIPIKKKSIHTDDAIMLFKDQRMHDKEKLFRYRRVSKVNIYSIEEYQDYYYGYMVPSTGYLKYYDLKCYDEGFVLCLPERHKPEELPEFDPQCKLFYVLNESKKWGEHLKLATVGDLNETIARGGLNQMILVQEALQEKKIAEIAQTIAQSKSKKIIMIAGPSSSGKTTFSHRLSVQLQAHGMNPHPIALDNYFIDRDKCPLDEYGKPDFEGLAALDVELFNKNMTALLRGESVELPYYNFKTGKQEYKGNIKKLGRDDILVLEGIHGLNDALSYTLPKESKYKIYISALTQLNIDEHNRIPSTDGRLIRRMVRDSRTRNITAKGTLSMWDSVRRGEEHNIFPYQEQADVMFNSALIYELAVLKQFAEPILFGIEKEDPEYSEAKRLLKFLDYFLGIPTDDVPKNSILREFIGGSCFHV